MTTSFAAHHLVGTKRADDAAVYQLVIPEILRRGKRSAPRLASRSPAVTA